MDYKKKYLKYKLKYLTAKKLYGGAEPTRVGDKRKIGEITAEAFCKAIKESDNTTITQMLHDDPNLVNTPDPFSKELPLNIATSAGNIALVKLLLDNRANLDAINKNNNNKTAFIIASQKGHHEVVEELLLRGANVNAADASGSTALIYASKNGYLNIVGKLMETTANVNIRDNNHFTPLMYASQKGYLRIVQMLLHREANVNILGPRVEGEHRGTALLYAAHNRYYNIVKTLIRYGANVNAALHQASELGRNEVVNTLLENGVNANVMFRGIPVLYKAALHRNYVIMETLLRYDADINAALLTASKLGSNEVVNTLLHYGADVNHRSVEGFTALALAAAHGHIELVKVFFENALVTNTDRKNSLLYAAASGRNEVLQVILNYGIDINTVNEFNLTALMHAVKNGKYQTVNMLLQSGANVDIKNNEGKTAVSYAEQGMRTAPSQPSINLYTKIIQLLLEYGSTTDVGQVA